MSRKIKITTELDFTSNKTSLENIKKQLDTAMKTVELNMDINSQDKKKMMDYFSELERVAEKSFNTSTQKINKKVMDAYLSNSDIIPNLDTFNQELNALGVNGSKSFKQISDSNKVFSQNLQESETILDRMGYTLANTIRWNISSTIVNAFTGSIREAYYYAKDLDRELTNISIVSGESTENMRRFAAEANESAKAIGSTTLEYVEASKIFYQQGLAKDAVVEMTDATTMASNITGTAAAEMADLLTSTVNGYKMAVDEVLDVTDKLAAVGANTAADFGELATGMSKVASMANAAGVDIDQLNAQLATIVSVTREAPESIGTSLKTIYGRMLMFKNNTTDMMEDEDGELFGVPSVEAALEKFGRATDTHISLFETLADGSRGELRELGDVIEEIGGAWDQTSDKAAKFGLATALAGSRQQNRLVALFDSWEDYEDAVITSLTAEGTTLEQNAIYMESYEGRIKGLQTAKEDLYMSITQDSESMKGLISGLTKAIELSATLIDTIGGVVGVIATVSTALSSIAVPKAFEQMEKISENMEARKTLVNVDDQGELKVFDDLIAYQKALGDTAAESEQRAREYLNNEKQRLAVTRDLQAERVSGIRAVIDITRELEGVEESSNSEARIKSITEATRERARALDEVVEKNKGTEGAQEFERFAEMVKERDSLLIQSAELEQQAQQQSLIHNQEKSDSLRALADETRNAATQINSEIEQSAVSMEQAFADTGDSIDIVNKQLDIQANNIARVADEYRKQQQAITGVNAVLRVGIPTMMAALDTSKGLLDVIKSAVPGLLSFVPAIVSNFAAIKTGVIGTGTAIAGATGLAGKLGAGIAGIGGTAVIGPLLAVVGVFGVLAGAIRFATKDARELEEAIGKVEEARSERMEVEDEEARLTGELEMIKQQREELQKLGSDRSDEQDELLLKMESESQEIERQIELQQRLLEIKREEESEAIIDRLGVSSPSDYATEVTGYSLSGIIEGAADTTPIEELREALQLYKEQENVLNELIFRRNELANIQDKTDEQVLEMQELNNTIDEQTSANTKLIGEIEKLKKALADERDGLTDTTAEGREYRKEITELVDTIDDVVDAYFDLNKAKEEQKSPADTIKEEEAAWDSLLERYDDYSDKIFDLYEITQDMEATQYDQIKAQEELAEVYGEFIELDLPEEFFQNAENMELLTEALYGSEDAWHQLIINAMMSEESIYAVASEYAESAADIVGITEALDTLEFAVDGTMDATQFFEMMMAMGYTVEQAQEMLEELAGTEIEFNVSMKDMIMSQDEDGNMTMGQVIDKVTGSLKNRGGRTPFEGFRGLGSRRPPSGGSSRGGRGGGGRGGRGGGGGGSSARDEKKYLDILDAQIRAIQYRNEGLVKTQDLLEEQLKTAKDDDSLEGLNKQYALTEKIITSNIEVLKSFKKEQNSISEKAKEIREEYSQFNIDSWFFDGTTDQTPEFIEQHNAATAAQQEEMSKVFDWIQKLKKAWMEANDEVKKAVDYTKELEKALNDIMKKEFDTRFSQSKRWIDQRKFYEDWEDFKQDGDEGLADNEIAAWERVRAYTIDYYNKGHISHEHYIDRMMEADRAIATEQNRLYDEAHAEREKLRQEWIDDANAVLQEQRDRLSALESIQEAVVQIIRKRGEKEREALDESHRLEMESLEERHRERQKGYEDELNGFREMIQGKIDALEEQYYEEDYFEALEKERRKAIELQSEIDVLSLDDSLVARNKTIALRKQLAEQNEKIAKMQQTRERKLLRDSLENQLKDKEKEMRDKNEIAEENYENERKRIEEDYKINSEYLDKKYSDRAVYSEARQAILDDEVKNVEGKFVSIYDAYKDFEDEFGKGMGILGDIIKDDFIKQLDNAQKSIKELSDATGRLRRPRDDYSSDHELSDKDLGWEDPGYNKADPKRPSKREPDMGYGAAVGKEARDNEAKLKEDKAYLEAEKRRAKKVIRDREAAGEDTSVQRRYLERLRSGTYKHGGKVTETGFTLNEFHGSKAKPEWIFNDEQLKSIIDNVSLSAIKNIIPTVKKPPVRKEQDIFEIDKLINIEGNVDEKVMPDLEKAGNNIADVIKDLNKGGIFRTIKI